MKTLVRRRSPDVLQTDRSNPPSPARKAKTDAIDPITTIWIVQSISSASATPLACAGVIAAEADSELTVGAAPGVRLAPIKWPSSGPSLFIGDTRLRRAFQYLADRVDVISNSWGSTPTSSWAQTTLALIDDMAANRGRRGKGIVFLWAAGNENCPISHQAAQDTPFTDGWQLQANNTWRWVGVRTTRTFSNDLAGRPGVMHRR